MPRLCPVGFVFIWAPKQLLHAVVTQLYKWQFGYVESLTWVQLRGQTELLTLPSPCFRQSHVTLLMFRRTGVCTFDCLMISVGDVLLFRDCSHR